MHSMRGILFAVLLMSGVVNVLMLTGAIYMLQIYDRVLTSHSVPTLVALSALVAGLYVLYGLLDVLRKRCAAPTFHDGAGPMILAGHGTGSF